MSSEKSKRKVEVGRKDRGPSEESSQRKVSVFERLGRSTQPEPQDRQQKCRNWERTGECSYGSKCVFKHEDGGRNSVHKSRRSRSTDRTWDSSPGKRDQRRSSVEHSRGQESSKPKRQPSPSPRHAKDKARERSKSPSSNKESSGNSSRRSQPAVAMQSTVVASKPSRFEPDTDDEDEDDEQELLRKKRAIQNELKKLQEEAISGVANEVDFTAEDTPVAPPPSATRPSQKVSPRGPCTPPPMSAPPSSNHPGSRTSSNASKMKPKSLVTEKAAVPAEAKQERTTSVGATVKPPIKKRPLPPIGKEEGNSKAKKIKLSPTARSNPHEGEPRRPEPRPLLQSGANKAGTSTQTRDGPQKVQKSKPQSGAGIKSSKDSKLQPSSAGHRSPDKATASVKSEGGQTRTDKKVMGLPADNVSSKKSDLRVDSRSPRPARSGVVSTVSSTKKLERQPVSPPLQATKRSSSPAPRPPSTRWESPPAPSKDKRVNVQHQSRPRSPASKPEPEREKSSHSSIVVGNKESKPSKQSSVRSPSRSPARRKGDRNISPARSRPHRQEKSRTPDNVRQDQGVKPKVKVNQDRPQSGASTKALIKTDRHVPAAAETGKKITTGQAKSDPRAHDMRASAEKISARRTSSSRSPSKACSPAAATSSRSGAGGENKVGRAPQRRRESSQSGSERGGRDTTSGKSSKGIRQDSKQDVVPNLKGSKDSRLAREHSPAKRSPVRSPQKSSLRRRLSGSPRSVREKRSLSGDRRSHPRSPLREDGKSSRQPDHHSSSRGQRRGYPEPSSKEKRYEENTARRDDEGHLRARSRSPYEGKRRSEAHRGTKDDRRSPPLLPPQLLFPPLPPFYPLPPRDGDRPLSPHGFGLLSHAPFSSDFFKHDRPPYDDRGSSSHLKESSRYKERDLPPEAFNRTRRSPPASPVRRRDSSPQQYHRGDANRPLLPIPDFRARSPHDSLRLLLPPLPRDLRDLTLLLPPRSPPESYRRERERQPSGEPRPRYGSERKATQDRAFERSSARFSSPPPPHGFGDSGRLLPPSAYQEGSERSHRLLPSGGGTHVRRPLDHPQESDSGNGRRKYGGGLLQGPPLGRDVDRSGPFVRGRGRMRIGRGPIIGRDMARRGMLPGELVSKDGEKVSESARRLNSSRQDQIRKRPRSPTDGEGSGARRSSVSPRRLREGDGPLSPPGGRREGSEVRLDDISVMNRQRPRSHERDLVSSDHEEPMHKRRRFDSDRKVPLRATEGSRDRPLISSQRARARGDLSPRQSPSNNAKVKPKSDRAVLSPSRSRKSSDTARDASDANSNTGLSSGASPVTAVESSSHLAPSIADEELESLMSLQNDADKEEQEAKTSGAANSVDVDWTSMMSNAGSAESAAEDEQNQQNPPASALSLFSPAAVLSRIGVSRVHAGDERYQIILDCIAEAAEQSRTVGPAGLLDDIPLLHVRKRLEKASCQSLLADIGPGKKALWARKDLAIRRKLAGPGKTAVTASRSSCGAVDRDLVKLSLQLFAADPIQVKSTRSDVDVPT